MNILDLKLTYRCNNDCKYCCQERSLRRLKSDISIAMVKNFLTQENVDKIDKVVLTGGEPTLNPYLGEIAKCIKDRQIKNIQLQTNARTLKNKDYLDYLIHCGINGFGISLHGCTAMMHEAFTGTSRSFNDVFEALINIREIKILVSLNCVITKHNVDKLEDILTFVTDNNLATSLQFAFIHITGKAESGLKDYVSITEAANAVRMLEKKHRAKIKIATEAIPLCLMYGCEKLVSELTNTADIVTYDYRLRREFSEDRVNKYKTKFEQCKKCLFFSHCEGTWIEYPKEYGQTEFVPVKTFRRNYVDA